MDKNKSWLEQQLNANRQSSNKNKQTFAGYGGLTLEKLIQHEVITPSIVMTKLEDESYDVYKNKLDTLIGEKLTLEHPFTGIIHVGMKQKSRNKIRRVEILHIHNNEITMLEYNDIMLDNIVSPHRLDAHKDYDR